MQNIITLTKKYIYFFLKENILCDHNGCHFNNIKNTVFEFIFYNDFKNIKQTHRKLEKIIIQDSWMSFNQF